MRANLDTRRLEAVVPPGHVVIVVDDSGRLVRIVSVMTAVRAMRCADLIPSPASPLRLVVLGWRRSQLIPLPGYLSKEQSR